MAETKPYRSPEINKSKNSTEKNKGDESNPKRYRGRNNLTKTQGPEPEADTNFTDWCSDIEGYIFALGPRASDKFTRTMKDLER